MRNRVSICTLIIVLICPFSQAARGQEAGPVQPRPARMVEESQRSSGVYPLDQFKQGLQLRPSRTLPSGAGGSFSSSPKEHPIGLGSLWPPKQLDLARRGLDDRAVSAKWDRLYFGQSLPS
jgi:hypothetical protein